MWLNVDAILTEVPVNILPLTSNSDFDTVDETIAYDESGMELYWHFTKTDGSTTVTAVTPTTGGGKHDWAHQDHGMYTIGMPIEGGDVNNTQEGFGHFTGKCDGVLSWTGPEIGFRKTQLNGPLIDGSGTLQVNVVSLGGVGQRATDLAELVQYLIANSCTLTDIVADNSLLAQLLATGGDISEYSKTTDSLQAIRDRGDSAWTTATSVGLTTAGLQDIANLVHGAGTIYYVDTAGDDGNDGLSWDTAKLSPKTIIEAASSGDLVLIGLGTFAIGNQYIEVPDGVSVRGAGVAGTTVTFTLNHSNYANIRPGSNARFGDLTIDATLGGSFAHNPLGAKGQNTAFTNAYIWNVRIVGKSDALYISNASACTAIVENLTAECTFDSLIVGGGGAHVITLIRSRLIIDAGDVAESTARGVNQTCGTLRLSDVVISARNGGSVTYGIYATGGVIEAFDVKILTESGSGTILDIVNNTTADIRLIDCQYDRTKTSGTVTDVARVKTDTSGYAYLNAAWDAAKTASKAGDKMNLVDAPNETAVAAIQDGLSTYDGSDTSGTGTLLTRISADRSGYLDKLSVEGTLAHSGAASTYKANVSALALEATLTAMKGDGWTSETLKALSDQLAALESLSGEGAYTGTLTVDDGDGTGLEGAAVNARRGGVLKASGPTDADGEITDWVFGAYTYDLAVRLDGYEPGTDTITVSADAWTKTISLTAISISASEPGQTTGYLYCYDEDGAVEEDVTVTVQLTAVAEATGYAYDNAVRSATSSAAGLVEFTNLFKEATYRVRRGGGIEYSVTIPAAAGSTYELVSVIGSD